MKVYIDQKPLKDGNATRGVGYFTRFLLHALTTYHPEIVLTADSKDADLIHYPYFDLFFPTLDMIKGKKSIVTVHDVIPLLFPKHYPKGIRGRMALWRQKRALRKVDAIMTVSRQSKEDIERLLKIPEDKLFVTYESVDERFIPLSQDQLMAIKMKYQLPDRFVLYVGDVNYNKNVPGLIQAFSMIGLPDVRLILVGSAFLDTTLREVQTIDKAIATYKLTDRVKKLGFVPDEDIVQVFNLATVYVQPSFYEGFGLPVLSAFQTGTPVACANTSSLLELAGDAAYLFDPYDEASMVYAMSTMLKSDELRLQYAEKGKQQALRFSPKAFADTIVSVYNRF